MQNRLLRMEREAIDRDATAKPAVFGTIVAGSPDEAYVPVFDAARFACGVWQCTQGVVAMKDWPYDEFCILLSGRVVITPQGGTAQEYAQGDAFVIPKGFTGTWDIKETIRKYYAVQKHPTALGRLKSMVRGLLPL
ncbi:MAG TPA: cupin domain-containing protein [Azospirillum sp.]|nr:cupin domain-containing protein [Azospirillum sp.]